MFFSRQGLLVALLLVISASARPADKRWGGWGLGSWGQSHPSKTSDFMEIGKRWGESAGGCDLNNALGSMNLAAVSPALPQPIAGSKLFQVAIGRGTQNYTCDASNATAVPVPVGALATLLNVSCIAADYPALLPMLTRVALRAPVPQASYGSSDPVEKVLTDAISGHHYFLDDTTPFFNMDTELHQYGMGALQKSNASDAPSGAMSTPKKGKNDKLIGDGAVQWLKLDVKPYVQDKWKQVYRLRTAGGVPPKTCAEAGTNVTEIQVDYAAEYWFFV